MPLGELAEFVMGQAPPGKDCNKSGHGTPFVRAGEFGGLFPEVRAWTTKPLKLSLRGDVLLCVVGATVGKVNMAIDSAIGRSVAAVRPAVGELNERYLYHYLTSQTMVLRNGSRGSAQSVITLRDLADIAVPLVTLDEQRRIVDILEDHLSRLDAGDRGLGETVERLRLMKVSSLVHNVRSHEESSAESLMLGDQSLALAPDWTSSCVAQVAELVEYGTSSKAHEGEGAEDVPVLRMGNVKDGRLVWGSLKYLASDHPDARKLMLLPGDLLFNRTNSAEHVGKSAVFEGERDAATFASYLIRVRFRPEVDPRWANMVINSPYGRAYVTSVTSQQVEPPRVQWRASCPGSGCRTGVF